MTKYSVTYLNKPKEIKRMLAYSHKALTVLTQADYISCELSNRNQIDYHAKSALTKYFGSALERIRELNAYLETIVGE